MLLDAIERVLLLKKVEVTATFTAIAVILIHHSVSYLAWNAIVICCADGAAGAGHIETLSAICMSRRSSIGTLKVLFEYFFVDARPRLCNRLVFPLHNLHDFVQKYRILVIYVPLPVELWSAAVPVSAFWCEALVCHRS